MDLAGLAVLYGDSGACVIDKQFLAGVVLLAECEFLSSAPFAVQLAESRITVSIGLGLFVLAPDQFQGEVLVGFQLLADGRKVRRGMASAAGRAGSFAEQKLIQLAVG